MQAVEYVRRRDGGWYVGESGVTVYSVVSLWRQGFSPEEIQASFTPLSLRDVYGTILYYMENRDQLDAYFREQETSFGARRPKVRRNGLSSTLRCASELPDFGNQTFAHECSC